MKKIRVRGSEVIDRLHAMRIPFVVERAQFPMEEDDNVEITGTNYSIQIGDGYAQLWEKNGAKFRMWPFETVSEIMTHLAVVL
jgi:hypothetical protein